jgi:hypothetical protein
LYKITEPKALNPAPSFFFVLVEVELAPEAVPVGLLVPDNVL